MSGAHSKMARFLQKQKEKQLDLERKTALDEQIAPDRRMAPALDVNEKDLSAVMRKKFHALMEMQDLMIEEMRESFKNDLKEMLMKDGTLSKDRKEWQEVKDSTSVESKLAEKTEERNCDLDNSTENLTMKRKEGSKPSSKVDRTKGHNGEKSSQSSRTLKRACLSHMEEVSEGENIKKVEDEPAKGTQEEASHRSAKNKESALTSSREDSSPEEGAVLRLAADFSKATLDISKQWASIFNILRENHLEPELLCTVNLAFKCDGEIKTFSDLQSLRKFISKKSFMRELLKDVLLQKETMNQGRTWIQERLGKTLGDTKHETRGTASEGLSFLFIKEVKIQEDSMSGLEVDGEISEVEEGEEETETSEEEEASDMGEEGSEMGEEERASEIEEHSSWEGEEEESSETEEEEEHTSGEGEEEGENSETGEEEEASVLHQKQGSTFQGLTVVDTKQGVEEISLIGLVIDSESEEEIKTKTKKKETLFGLKELAFSYLVWDSKKKRLVKHREAEGTAVSQGRRVGTPCLTLYLAPPSESLEMSNGDPKWHSSANLSAPSQITSLLKNTEKERHKTLQIEVKEEALIQESGKNFRSVTDMFRELQGEIEKVKKMHFSEVSEIKNSLDDLNSLACMIEARVNDQEDVVEGLTKDTVQLAKEILDKEDRLRSCNIRIIGIPEKDDKENGAEDIIKEIIEENFPDLKDLNIEIISAHRIPNTVDEHRLTPRHILVKCCNSSDKQKILKASREREEITYRGKRIRMTADLSPGTIDARSRWARIIEVLQKEGFQPRVLYPAKLAFNFKGKTKVFVHIEEFKKFISDIPSLKELLDNVL